MSNFFDEYYAHVEERKKEGVPPLALSAAKPKSWSPSFRTFLPERARNCLIC